MKKILVIDDEPAMLKVIKIRLEDAKYEVFTAENGKEGFKKAKEILPDLIMLDILMPELDGTATFNLLNQEPTTTNIPVIFLTATINKAEEEQLKSRLGEPYVTLLAKPFDSKQVLLKIEQLIGRNF